MIHLNDLTYRLGPRLLFDKATVALPPGGRIGFVGRNGTGKTTLIDTLVGVTRRHAGRLVLAGRELHHLAPFERAAAGIGWVPQERNIFKSLSVEENLTAVARPGPWTVSRVYELFPRLQERRRNLGTQLSGGEQQMLALACAVATQPRCLLIDELSLGLAPIIVQQLVPVVRQIAQAGVGVLLVEQHVTVALGVADRAYVLAQGAVQLSGAASELAATPERLQQAYLG